MAHNKGSDLARCKRQGEWLKARQFVVALSVAYAVLLQALLSPALRARALEHAGPNSGLAVLCVTQDAAGQENPGESRLPHGHGLDCCLPGARNLMLDAPALVTSFVSYEQPVEGRGDPAGYVLPQARAPPAALTRVLQPRAPPVSIT